MTIKVVVAGRTSQVVPLAVGDLITQPGDIPIGGPGGVPTALAVGAVGQRIRRKNGENRPAWGRDESLNALDFLAGDGATDDAANLNTLLQTTAVNGDVIRFPRGAYLVGSQITYSGKKLTLIFEPGATLKESGTFTTPILFLSNADGSVVRGLVVEGSEANFVGTVDPQRYAVEAELSADVVLRDVVVTGKSRGLLLDNCQRALVSGWQQQGLIHATQINAVGGIDAVTTTITVDSTAGFLASDTIKIDNEEITYTGITATTFTGATRGANGTTAASHADNAPVVEWVANRNYHATINLINSRHCVVHGVRTDDIGAACLQGGSVVALSGGNVYSDIRGRNCYDNGVKIDGGDDCDVIGAFIEMDAGKRQTVGGSAVKVRGSRHRVVGGGALGTFNGVTLTGNGDANDGYGASGHGSTVTGFVAEQTRGPGFAVGLNTGFETNSPMRDAVFTGCVAEACVQDAEIRGSFSIIGGIGIHLDGCKVVDHTGDAVSSAAIMLSRNVTPERRVKRAVLSGCEIIWPDASPPACHSVRLVGCDDTLIDALTLVNTNAIGVNIIESNRTRVTNLHPINVSAIAGTVFAADSTAVDTVAEIVSGMIWGDSGTNSQPDWPLGRTRVVTAASAVVVGDEVIEAGGAGAAFTVTLPLIARSKNRTITLKRTHATNNITLDGSGAETIDGAAAKRLDTQYAFVTVWGGATEWHVIAQGGTIT